MTIKILKWIGNKLQGYVCGSCGEELIEPEAAQKALMIERLRGEKKDGK